MCEIDIYYCACCKNPMKIGLETICKWIYCCWTFYNYIIHNNCNFCLFHQHACVIYPTELYKKQGHEDRLHDYGTVTLSKTESTNLNLNDFDIFLF